MTFREPLALPSPALYQKRFSEYEDYILETQNAYNERIGAPTVEWDAWVDVMHTTMAAKEPSEMNGYQNPLHYRHRRLAQLGLSLESFESLFDSQRPAYENDGDTLEQVEPLRYRMQFAFAQGYLQQQYIIDRMYKEAISFDGTFESIRDLMNENILDTESVREQHEDFSRRVKQVGVQGLMATGYARGFIEKWAQEVYPGEGQQDLGRREAFRIGHGVAIKGAIIFHEQMNEVIISEMGIESLSPDVFVLPDTDSTRDTE